VNSEYQALMDAYATELREKKALAEDWWQRLSDEFEKHPGPYKLKQVWPMGPATHPWIIAVYRKYFFLCQQLNQKYERFDQAGPSHASAKEELKWGNDVEEEQGEGPIEPHVFVHEMLYGGETQDLALFVERLVFVPIGIRDGREV
jgi:hypothetical protein